jgi:hypothetical protein
MLWPKFKRRRGTAQSRPRFVYQGRTGHAHPVVEAIEAGTGPRTVIRWRTHRAGAEEVRRGIGL